MFNALQRLHVFNIINKKQIVKNHAKMFEKFAYSKFLSMSLKRLPYCLCTLDLKNNLFFDILTTFSIKMKNLGNKSSKTKRLYKRKKLQYKSEQPTSTTNNKNSSSNEVIVT